MKIKIVEKTEIITFKKDVSPLNDCGYSVDIKPTNDHGYIVAGCKNDSVWLMKTDEFGNTQWENTYGLLDYWGDRTVIQTSDDGFISLLDWSFEDEFIRFIRMERKVSKVIVINILITRISLNIVMDFITL